MGSVNLLTAKQAKAIDEKARSEFGISTLVLMENAGRSVAEEALKSLKDKGRIAIFCGKGNNGGDGLVAARHLLTHNINPEIFLAANFKEVQKEARINLDILLRLGQKIIQLSKQKLPLIKKNIAKYDLIIDALLGVGLKGSVQGIYKDLIRIINSSRAYVLAVDIPSGLDATSGRALGSCVKADETITFVAKKRGMILGNGPQFCGRIVVKDLGIPL